MKKKQDKKPLGNKYQYSSWKTTDEQEIQVRKKRALEEGMTIKRIENGKKLFIDYIVSKKGVDNPVEYRVEIRSLRERHNYCTCPDFLKNSLGTCKHIEKVLLTTKRRNLLSPFTEVFVDFSDNSTIRVVESIQITKRSKTFLKKFLKLNGTFKQPLENTLQVFVRNYLDAEQEIRESIRVSAAIVQRANDYSRRAINKNIQKEYGDKLRKAAGEAEFLRHPLYDYQIDGMLHLAFTERAMLADEMGLGKTVQAVAASHVLHELHDIKRTLIVCPASLKTEWEEQIEKFTGLSSKSLFGSKDDRIQEYRNGKEFFLITNYEQVLRDFQEINDFFQPDLVILDEAQRIKNWKTKTAQSIKRLQSRFAFVLTGTPLENKIDELYSLTEFIDPTIFGSLFRFNRNFYNFDEAGKTDGFRNLRELHETVNPVMLRRRKDQISEQLPERIDNNYFVTMTKEQRKVYAEYEYSVAILMSIAKYRPLRPEEHDQLQQKLACMRMICDTLFILDKKTKVSPKVDELSKILDDIWENDPSRKVIIFSEWVKMLELVRDGLEEKNVAYSWHTGSVPQQARREEINRFKNEPDCKVFLSSDSGGVGLNLQAASVVVNMDLPWNPAKLEQRIARAWRKHQKNSVNVINLVAEKSIEHQMLATLSFKQGLADAVLDERGDIEALERPNARNSFVERLAELMKTTVGKTLPDSVETIVEEISSAEKFEQEIKLDAGENTRLCNTIKDKNNLKGIFAVSNNIEKTTQHILAAARKTDNTDLKKEDVTVIDESAYELLQELAKKGLITINNELSDEIYKVEKLSKPKEDISKKLLEMAKEVLGKADRKYRMAKVLSDGDFGQEALVPASESILVAGCALYVLTFELLPEKEPENFEEKYVSIIKEKLLLDDKYVLLLKDCLAAKVEGVNLLEKNYELLLEVTRMINSHRRTE